MTFGQTIAAARKELGISQRELASRVVKEDGVPISAQYLNDIKRERRNPPGEHLLGQFAKGTVHGLVETGVDHNPVYLSAASEDPVQQRDPGLESCPQS